MKHLKKIPAFNNEADEQKFWSTHDAADYLPLANAKRVRLTNLKPTTESISLRLPISMLERIKTLANKNDVPYQSLIKMYLSERVKEETEKWK